MDQIHTKLNSCKQHLSLLLSNAKHSHVIVWFQELCNLIAGIILELASHTKDGKMLIHRVNVKMVFLYLTQIVTLLSLFIQVFLNEDKIKGSIMEARNFIIKQLYCCFEGIDSQLNENESIITQNESFQKLVDISLVKLAEIDVTTDREIYLKQYYLSRKHVEDVLCHSMSIAQVVYEEDSKIIRGSCKAVLSDLDSLLEEISRNNINIALCNLSVDSCYDKLCSLERKVNTCVLRLSLKVFSRYLKPLEKLTDCCFDRLVNSEALDDIIVEFDLHVDRIMQIGFFASSSTSNVTSTTKMKNCLASLEALESELVPSLNAVFNNIHQNKHFASLLVKHWKQQAQSLQKMVYGIMDPFAFCQVAYEEIKLHLDNIISNSSHQEVLPMSALTDIIEESTVLESIITVSIQDVDLDNLKSVEDVCKDIRNVIHEIKCAIDLLLIRNRPTNLGNDRVIKRCKILKGLIKNLLLSLAEDSMLPDNNKVLEDAPTDNTKSATSNDAVNKSLEYITSKSKEIIKERSILYKTPKLTSARGVKDQISSQLNSNKKPIPLSKLVHLRNIQFSNSSKGNEESSFDLQITAILADLENISISTSS